MRRVVVSCAVVGIGMAACMPQNQCPFQWVEYCMVGDANCNGHLVDANHWESGPLFGDWLDYSHNKNLFMHFRDGKTGAQLVGEVVDVAVSVSPDRRPNDQGGQYAGAAGNLAEIHVSADGSGWAADIHNDTCADYFVRVYVTTSPASGADAATD